MEKGSEKITSGTASQADVSPNVQTEYHARHLVVISNAKVVNPAYMILPVDIVVPGTVVCNAPPKPGGHTEVVVV